MNETLKNILLFIVILILYLISIFSTYVLSYIDNEKNINEENKKIITPIFATNLIIHILFVSYMLISNSIYNYNILEYITLIITVVGIIISLIYIAQRDNQELINKNFVFYTLIYKILISFFILFNIIYNSCKK